MSDIQHKRALVTGASRGIGKAIALQLARDGVDVCVHYHDNKQEAVEVARSVRSTGRRAEIAQADLSDPAQVANLAALAWEMMGGIDYLVNNAGVSYKKHFLDTTIEDINHFYDINFKGTLLLTQGIAKRMVEAGTPGSIYTITSLNGIQPGVGLSVYGASKGALETLMKGVALELAPHSINVNTFAIGAIKTDMNASAWKDGETLQLINENIPLGRLGQPEEIAAVICSLLATATYMTGATIVIDGGWILKHGYSKPKPYQSEP